MSKKRVAGTDLNHDNWDQEDDEDEEAGEISLASSEVLQSRVFLKAKRKRASESKETEAKNVFQGFSFGNSNSSNAASAATFSFLPTSSKSENKDSPTTTNTNGNTVTTSTSSTGGHSNVVTFVNENKSENSYHKEIANLNESFLKWITHHIKKNPHCILTPVLRDYNKYINELDKEYSYPSSQDSADEEKDVCVKDDGKKSKLTRSPIRKAVAFDLTATEHNPPITSSSLTTTTTAAKTFKFGSNMSSDVVSATTTSTSTSSATTTTIATFNFGSASTASFNFGSTPSTTIATSSSFNLFNSANKSTTTTTTTTSASQFTFGSRSSLAPTSTGFTFGITTAAASIFSFKSNGSDKKADDGDSNVEGTKTNPEPDKSALFGSFKFKSSQEQSNPSSDKTDAPTTNFFGFSTGTSKSTFPSSRFKFTSNQEEPVDQPVSKSDAPIPPANPTFNFSSSTTPFSFGSSAVTSTTFGKGFFNKPTEEGTTEANAEGEKEEEYEPPKVEDVETKEDGSFYSIRCKLYCKKDEKYEERGVGFLHLKPNGNKTQLIIRAATTLGNILLNINVDKLIPMSRQGVNNINLICIPNPPVDLKKPNKKPIPMLIRVKTKENADELFKHLTEAQAKL